MPPAPEPPPASADDVRLRHDLRPGDLGWIVHRHGRVYAAEHGFDASFEAYVAGPLSEFARRASARERIWIAERRGEFAGSVAVVAASHAEAQLRWFLVEPALRGRGIGTRLLDEAVRFARRQGYASLFLWTVFSLQAAARRYRAAGFVKAEERPGLRWGVPVVEERHVLALRPGEGSDGILR